MKRNVTNLIHCLLLALLIQCKKDPSPSPLVDEYDAILEKDVFGGVNNLCTDSGIAGIPVYLEIRRDGKLKQKLFQTSGERGTFRFSAVQLHTNKSYSYNLYIPSKSGIAAKDRETCGLMGGSLSFTPQDADGALTPNVIPSFVHLSFYFPRKQTTVVSDSIIARFEQRTYHKNVPDYPYKFGEGSIGTLDWSKTEAGIGNYPMGLYHIRVDKWIDGQLTRWNDSIYINYGDTAAYVVHW